MEVELRSAEFEFKHDATNRPTGHYARGVILKWYDAENCLVKLHCNGKAYRVHKSIIVET